MDRRYRSETFYTILVVVLCSNYVGRSNGDVVIGQQQQSIATDTTRRWNFNNGDRRACFGTENGMGKVTYESGSLKRLRDMYMNCSIVYGNLEIVGITWKDLMNEGMQSLDFFDKIEEVFGYVLIASNSLHHLSFPNLRIIWGDKKYVPQQDRTPIATNAAPNSVGNFSLFLVGNGLDYVDMRSLRGVVEGRVGVVSNNRLCHWKTGAIDWTQILGDNYRAENRFMTDVSKTDECFAKAASEKTPMCSSECEYNHCWWSNGSAYCQQVYRKNCAPQCGNGMCFNQTNPLSCCSMECAAGCFGPTNRDCYGCRVMRDEGVCVDKCPARELYNVKTAEYEQNPNGKFALNRECVKACPEHMYVYKEGCVTRCPEGYYAEDNETFCKPCNGPCPKTCNIDKPLNALNLHEFVNCTIIEGRVEILHNAFTSGAEFDEVTGTFTRYQALNVSDLDVLIDVQRITHYLFVQSSILTSLKFLRNLKQIDGRKKHEQQYALMVSSSTLLTELGLHSLKRIVDGNVYVGSNPQLCLAETLPWKTIAPALSIDGSGARNNRPLEDCAASNIFCHEWCENSTGCWGVGVNMCYSCRYYELGGTCARECPQSENLFAIGKKCDACHSECNGCKGPGPRQCIACKNVQLDGACVAECPAGSHYQDGNKRCLPCHANCFENGCTGPGNYIGPGGCKKCRFAAVNPYTDRADCLPELSMARSCRDYSNLTEYFLTAPPVRWRQHVESWACIKCHDVCKTCEFAGVDDAAGCECKEYRLIDPVSNERTCVAKCERNTFAKMTISTPGSPIDCYPCHEECETCYGNESTQCYSCKNYADYYSTDGGVQFNCTSRCPDERRFSSNATCTDIDPGIELTKSQRNKEIIYGSVISTVFLLLIIACAFAYMKWRRLKMTAYLEPKDEMFEINPDAKPNLSQLRLIPDNELGTGNLLGKGAFGDVRSGVWKKNDGKAKYPVAIKTLHSASPAAEKEMLNEAGIMASMNHPFLLPLEGVCVGRQLRLITPLVPLGDLLTYVQNNKSKIGSKPLLRWCMQIASGMSYLEERRLVHRDLAARNVLVQTPYRIRITDFGLAKMLDYGEDELRITGEKMPIKWLALECIQFKRYTHKSDVWAFGVTVWELLTFGEKPYKDVQLQDIPSLLEKGERLPQPKICSLDVYMVLIKCWMVDADTRPSFKELAETFERFRKDPGRYLVIDGDKNLRLPEYTETDRKQNLEQMIDDPDVGDSDGLFSPANGSPATPISPMTPSSHGFWSNGCTSDSINSGGPYFRENAGRIRPGQRQQSTSSHRYASDPLKKTGMTNGMGRPDDVRSVTTPTTDMDNYLVPDSHFGSMGAPMTPDADLLTYTQLIENNQDDEASRNLEYYQHLRAAISGAVDDSSTPDRFDGLDNHVYIMQTPTTTALGVDPRSQQHQQASFAAMDRERGDGKEHRHELRRNDSSSSAQSITENESVV